MTRVLNVPLRVVSVRTVDGDFACPDCDAPLDLNQPSIDRPAELLATCAECSEWHLLILGDDDQATMTRLPLTAILAASAESARPASGGAATLNMQAGRASVAR